MHRSQVGEESGPGRFTRPGLTQLLPGTRSITPAPDREISPRQLGGVGSGKEKVRWESQKYSEKTPDPSLWSWRDESKK